MKPVVIGLFASVALNIALVGFMAGRLAGGAPPFGMRHGHFGPSSRMLEGASPATRDLLREAFASRQDALRTPREAVRARRKALLDAVVAEPFDRARTLAAFEAFQAADAELRGAHAGVVIDVMAKLPLTERRALIEALAQQRPMRGMRMRGRDESPSFRDPPP